MGLRRIPRPPELQRKPEGPETAINKREAFLTEQEGDSDLGRRRTLRKVRACSPQPPEPRSPSLSSHTSAGRHSLLQLQLPRPGWALKGAGSGLRPRVALGKRLNLSDSLKVSLVESPPLGCPVPDTSPDSDRAVNRKPYSYSAKQTQTSRSDRALMCLWGFER